MDSFNKVISFVLGLVVVLVFFAVVSGKINLKSKKDQASKPTVTSTTTQKDNGGFFGFFKSTKPTLTPIPAQKPSSVTISTNTNENNVYKQNTQLSKSSNAKSIPSAGLPTIFIPILFSGLAGGNFLRKAGKE